MDLSKIQAARRMHQDNTLSIDEICKVMKISQPTLYRYLNAGKRILEKNHEADFTILKISSKPIQ